MDKSQLVWILDWMRILHVCYFLGGSDGQWDFNCRNGSGNKRTRGDKIAKIRVVLDENYYTL
jgi:hypothetical protein